MSPGTLGLLEPFEDPSKLPIEVSGIPDLEVRLRTREHHRSLFHLALEFCRYCSRAVSVRSDHFEMDLTSLTSFPIDKWQFLAMDSSPWRNLADGPFLELLG